MLHKMNWPLLLYLSVWQKLVGKTVTNKLEVSSTTGTSLKTQIFIDVFLIETYEHAALREELLIDHFIESFKTNNLGKPYL